MNVFDRIYSTNWWKNPETRSGKGSTLEFTKPLRVALPPLLRRLKVHVMLDAGCGDFNWMKEVKLGRIEYHGWDVVDNMIQENRRRYFSPRRIFATRNVCEKGITLMDEWPNGLDLIFCRCCLYHLSNDCIAQALENFKLSGANWLLATTHPNVETWKDIPNGKWRRVNLEKLLGPAIEKIPDGPGDDGYLGLWRLKEE